MALELHPDISFCRLDGRLVFLDIGKDLYFELDERFAGALGVEQPNHEVDDGTRRDLARLGILAPAHALHAPPLRKRMTTPARSVLEAPPPARRASAMQLVRTLTNTSLVRIQLSKRGLKSTLDAMVEHRRGHAGTRSTPYPDDGRIELASHAFRRTRPLLPIGMRCLLDSIALVRCLAEQSIHADLVFGVACDPFSAHAWVQHGDVILNDSLGNVRAHVPIRAV